MQPRSKLLMLLCVVFCNWQNSFCQTIVDYETWTAPTYCNIFKATSDPQNPEIKVNNLAHLTTIGEPSYSSSAVVLAAQIVGGNQYYGTEYRIAYNFKKDYTYKIVINAKKTDIGTPSGAGVILRIDMNSSGGTNFNNSCNGTALIDNSYSGGLKRIEYANCGNLFVSPNPVDNTTTITLEQTNTKKLLDIKSVKITSSMGVEMRQWTFGAGTKKATLDLGTLPSGMYMVSATSDGKTWESAQLRKQ